MKREDVKKWLNLRFIIGGVLAVAIIIGIAYTRSNGGAPKISPKIAKEGGILSVNDIQADPYAYKGIITITGVVAGKSEFRLPSNVFLMVETAEAKTCKLTGCAKFYLPVRYEGENPKEWDEVNITGSFVEGDNLFRAEKVDILRHLTF